GRAGYTLHEIIWACQRRRTAARFDLEHIARLAIFRASNLTMGDIADRKHLLEVWGQQFVRTIEGHDRVSEHPWFGVQANSLGFADEEQLVDSLRDQLRVVDELTQAIKRKHDLLPDPLATSGAISVLIAAIESVPSAQDILTRLLSRLDDETVQHR